MEHEIAYTPAEARAAAPITAFRTHADRPAERVLLAALLLTAAGCAGLKPHSPPPARVESEVRIPGMPDVRTWGDEFSPAFQQDLVESIGQEERSGLFRQNGTVDFLAISGGGGDGAFGAGLLCGWSAAGNRPGFKIVTGISTGALTAPFAFLGPAYDDKLKQVYTTVSSRDIFRLKSLFGMLQTDAMSLNDPLARLTAEYVDEKMLADIAAEHAKGRRLFIGTAALDAQRPVVWNMGAIATSGHPDALELFRKVMIASAAVPVVFPPVYIPVEAGGKLYDEMHVDGGVAHQVFLYGPVLRPLAAVKSLGFSAPRRKGRVFVLRNSQIKPAWQSVRPLVRSIAPRTVSSLIKSQGIGDIYRIFATTQRDGGDFNLGYIPDQLDTTRSDEFDNRVMNVLFETGYKLARHGYRWQKVPPGFTRDATDDSTASTPAREKLDDDGPIVAPRGR
ncbi:patatin-like phospholipase family protein [Methylococcus sp. Mc7]|uniref:patatin-like phospholipase family protein n=1 Tax=Methylococcus sp. Mc7 TaxID=2860258 RepID=UPI001C52B3CC|nr:patatin-like phospholipase family protein [Methylococcus sp. Mc7]QXP83799.1 patatin-like phospholipase family protein [Methylococcus sp. Mc7]